MWPVSSSVAQPLSLLAQLPAPSFSDEENIIHILQRGTPSIMLHDKEREDMDKVLMNLWQPHICFRNIFFTGLQSHDTLSLDCTRPDRIILSARNASGMTVSCELGREHPYFSAISILTRACEWATASTMPSERRAEALQKLKDCVINKSGDLELSDLHLTSLPNLPGELASLNISQNCLTFLPELPSSLTTLNTTENLLTSLPQLPAGLTELKIGSNKVLELPPLPASLITLDASCNQLYCLPDLPASLRTLKVSDNKLSALPPRLPSLNLLDVSDNDLKALPPLPNSLTCLDANNNYLKNIPELPSQLVRHPSLCTEINHSKATTSSMGEDSVATGFATAQTDPTHSYIGPMRHSMSAEDYGSETRHMVYMEHIGYFHPACRKQ